MEVQTNFIKQIKLARVARQYPVYNCLGHYKGQLAGQKPYPYPSLRSCPLPIKQKIKWNNAWSQVTRTPSSGTSRTLASIPPPGKFSHFKKWQLQKLKMVASNRIQKETAVLALLYSNSCHGLGSYEDTSAIVHRWKYRLTRQNLKLSLWRQKILIRPYLTHAYKS